MQNLPNCLECNKKLGDYRSTYCKIHSKMSNKNPLWKGNEVQYGQLHSWVASKLPKTELCQKCNLAPAYDLSNKGIYNRELINWEWLCRKCHMSSDGRLTEFISHSNAGKRGINNANYRHGGYIK